MEILNIIAVTMNKMERLSIITVIVNVTSSMRIELRDHTVKIVHGSKLTMNPISNV